MESQLKISIWVGVQLNDSDFRYYEEKDVQEKQVELATSAYMTMLSTHRYWSCLIFQGCVESLMRRTLLADPSPFGYMERLIHTRLQEISPDVHSGWVKVGGESYFGFIKTCRMIRMRPSTGLRLVRMCISSTRIKDSFCQVQQNALSVYSEMLIHSKAVPTTRLVIWIV